MHETIEPQLWAEPVEDAYLRLHFEIGRGWLLSTSARRQGETWGKAEFHMYELLSAEEALDVLLTVAAGLLGFD